MRAGNEVSCLSPCKITIFVPLSAARFRGYMHGSKIKKLEEGQGALSTSTGCGGS